MLPAKLDDIINTQDQLTNDMTALNVALATTPQGGNLDTVDLNQVEERLKALYDDKQALDTLPERARLEREFHSAGLDELVADLSNRGVPNDAVAGELQLAWWTTAFEDIVKSSAIISNQDGSAMQSAADRFTQVDVEHVRSIGPMVAQESVRRLCDMLFSRTQEANLLHTTLAGSRNVPLNRLRREHPQILAAAKPILVATPATLAAITDPAPLADTVIIDTAAHIPSIELLSIIARAKQVVVIAHRKTVTSDGLQRLIALLPSVKITDRPVRRAPKLNAFLESEGYGSVPCDVAREGYQAKSRTIRAGRQRCAGHQFRPGRIKPAGDRRSGEYHPQARGRFHHRSRIVCAYRGGAHAHVPHPSGCRAQVACQQRQGHGHVVPAPRAHRGHRRCGRRPRHRRDSCDVLRQRPRTAGCCSSSARWNPTAARHAAGRFGGTGPSSRHRLVLRIRRYGRRATASGWSEGAQNRAALAEQLDDSMVRPAIKESGENVLFNDLAERIRERGLDVAVDYGFDDGLKLPLVVGLKGEPFALAVLTDDAQFMGLQSTRERHRVLLQDIESLGWSVMTVWSVGAFVNPDKEVDRIVARLGSLYREER